MAGPLTESETPIPQELEAEKFAAQALAEVANSMQRWSLESTQSTNRGLLAKNPPRFLADIPVDDPNLRFSTQQLENPNDNLLSLAAPLALARIKQARSELTDLSKKEKGVFNKLEEDITEKVGKWAVRTGALSWLLAACSNTASLSSSPARQPALEFANIMTTMVVPTLTPEPTPEPSLSPTTAESEQNLEVRYPSYTEVQGIPVYGLFEPIKSREDLENIIEGMETQTFSELSPDNTATIDRSLLPSNERYWEFVVPKSLYERFSDSQSTEIPQNRPRGIDFVSWAKLQVDKANEALVSAEPQIPYRVELKRVIVLDDSFFPAQEPYWLPEGDGDNFSRWPQDVDSRWAFGSVYYDYLFGLDWEIDHGFREARGAEVFFTTAGYTEVVQGEGAPSVVDWGMLHELFHHFDIGDIYWLAPQLPEQFDLPPGYSNFIYFPNDIMADPLIGRVSPLSAMAIRERALRGVRGVQHEPLSMTDNEYSYLPEGATIGFASSPINRIRLLGFENRVVDIDKDNFSEGKLVFTPEMTDLGWDFQSIILEGQVGNRHFAIPFPRFYFNMASWEGVDKPYFRVFFTGNDNPEATGLSLMVISPSAFDKYRKDPNLVAWTLIPGSEAIAIWKLVD